MMLLRLMISNVLVYTHRLAGSHFGDMLLLGCMVIVVLCMQAESVSLVLTFTVQCPVHVDQRNVDSRNCSFSSGILQLDSPPFEV